MEQKNFDIIRKNMAQHDKRQYVDRITEADKQDDLNTVIQSRLDAFHEVLLDDDPKMTPLRKESELKPIKKELADIYNDLFAKSNLETFDRGNVLAVILKDIELCEKCSPRDASKVQLFLDLINPKIIDMEMLVHIMNTNDAMFDTFESIAYGNKAVLTLGKELFPQNKNFQRLYAHRFNLPENN